MTEGNREAEMRKIRGLLSLCARARRLTSGAQGVETALRRGKGNLLLLDGDVSAETRKNLLALAGRSGIPAGECPFPVGEAIGKENRKTVLIQDAGFAQAICAGLDRLREAQAEPDTKITNRRNTGVDQT